MRPEGQIRDVEFAVKRHFLPGYHLVIMRDITELKMLQEQLAHQAFHDSLTNLPNRALFMDRLPQALARSERRGDFVAVLFLDLDDFKVINDSLGHKAGDQMLIEVGHRLLSSVRAGDSVARLGGDEFTILLEDMADISEATMVAERIAEQLRAPFHLEGHEVFVTTSIGIATSTLGHNTPEALLRNADIAMYEAKAKGKAIYKVFDQSMNSRAWERLQLEIDLRRAIESEEFKVYYQPVVRLDTGQIAEVEALVRWDHPQRNLVAPMEFIPFAEETGLILPIGHWVLDEACKQVKAWQTQYPLDPPLMLSVNLSARQFKHHHLVEDIASALNKSGLEPHCLKLEITETAALDGVESTIATLHELKDLGIQLAIDDFGTGYSALSYLKRYTVDTLKLDRSFIKGLGRDPEDTAIVRAILAFAEALNLNVTAEGIETSEQCAYLKALGCQYGQGFYFSKPIPPEDVAALLTTASGKLRITNHELQIEPQRH
jgi:diguanylate cyclase (GGDEF)-like protein